MSFLSSVVTLLSCNRSELLTVQCKCSWTVVSLCCFDQYRNLVRSFRFCLSKKIWQWALFWSCWSASWVNLPSSLLQTKGRQLPSEKILLGSSSFTASREADWGREATRESVISAVCIIPFLIDRLTDCLIDRSIRSIDWLIDCFYVLFYR